MKNITLLKVLSVSLLFISPLLSTTYAINQTSLDPKRWPDIRFEPLSIPGSNENWGYSVALTWNGSIAIVGSSNFDHNGAAYIFTKDKQRQWTPIQKLNLPDASSGMDCKVSTSFDAKTVLIGTYYKEGKNAAFVYNKNDKGTWELVQSLEISDDDGIKGYFSCLSSIGNTILISSTYQDNDKGAVYFFTKDEHGKWVQAQKLQGSEEGSLFGHSISISNYGKTAIVGAPGDNKEQGAVYVLNKNNKGVWVQTQKLTIKSTNNRFGRAVAISGDGKHLLCSNKHTVFLFIKDDNGHWDLKKEITDEHEHANYGCSLALSEDGKRFIIGSTDTIDRIYTGKADLFLINDEGFIQKTNELVGGLSLKAQDKPCLSVSNDGKIFIGSATAVNQPFSAVVFHH